MKLLLVLPLVIPLLTAAALIVARRWMGVQRWLGVGGAAALLAAAVALTATVRREGIQVVQVGDWAAPFGITLVADLFSALMVAMAGLMGLAVSIYSLIQVDPRRQAYGYFPLMHLLLMGVCGAFLTGDIFNLYVWFEVMLMASFVLLALGGERGQLEGAVKYVTINLLASAVFLAGVGVLYAAAGTLNMADLAWKLNQLDNPLMSSVLATLFLVAFGIKAAVFPLFFWLPASYHTPPAAVSALFAGLLTKVGVYSLIRVFTLMFCGDAYYFHILLAVAGLTMVVGVLGAIAQNEVRRLLSFHIVSQIGYMIMGLALMTPLALAGSIFCIVHNILAKTNLFLVSGVLERERGSGRLADQGGMLLASPALAAMFLISALSLAGLPPSSGFFAKLLLVRAGLELEQYAIVAAALGVSILTLFSMTKIWAEAFWKPDPALPPAAADEHAHGAPPPPPRVRVPRRMMGPIVLLALLSLAMGLAPGFGYELAREAADQLLDNGAYIRAVLGDLP